MNVVTDNLILFSENESIFSGGNFHGEPMALVMDFFRHRGGGALLNQRAAPGTHGEPHSL